MSSKDLYLIDEKEKIGEHILNWSEGNEMDLNVITVPWNGADIFLKTVLKYTKDNKTALYITEEKDNIQVIEEIKKKSDFRHYTYFRNNNGYLDSNLIITNFNSAKNLERKFDLVIYDEINSMPQYKSHEVVDLLYGLSKENGKRIFYSIEGALKNKSEIILPIKNRNVPVIEPRDIITRIDINKDIPYMVYDYIKWSINNNRNVLIYVPSEDKVEKVYNYITNYNWDKGCSISFFIKNKSDIKTILNFYKRKNSIMITNEFSLAPNSLTNTDIMVYFANDKVFNHKILTHITSRATRTERDSRGEVIFLYNERNENIDTAKEIVRNFNKEAWEMGLIRI